MPAVQVTMTFIFTAQSTFALSSQLKDFRGEIPYLFNRYTIYYCRHSLESSASVDNFDLKSTFSINMKSEFAAKT